LEDSPGNELSKASNEGDGSCWMGEWWKTERRMGRRSEGMVMMGRSRDAMVGRTGCRDVGGKTGAVREEDKAG